MFDPVGGPYVETLAKAMANDGLLLIYGGLSGQPTTHPHGSTPEPSAARLNPFQMG